MNKNKGITMISLVVTVIVLLILAGISIGMLSGNNSTIDQAINAKNKSEQADEIEQLKTQIVLAMGKTNDASIEIETLKTLITSNTDAKPGDETVFPLTATFDKTTGNVYEIDKNGDVKLQTE